MDSTKPEAGPDSDAPAPRRPYEPPAIIWEQATEIRQNLAAACAKIGGTGEPCETVQTS